MSSPALYSFPRNATLTELERERQLLLNQPLDGEMLFPLDTEESDLVLWEIRDDVKGLQLHRGAGEEYPKRDDSGVTRFYTKPGRFGEEVTLPEEYIERARRVGRFGDRIDVGAEISRIQQEIAEREVNLIEKIRWDLPILGAAQVADSAGKLHTVAKFTAQTFTPSVPWTTFATATILKDFRTIRDTFAGEHDTGGGAIAFMNSVTSNSLFSNTNANDLGGKKDRFGTSITSVERYNELFTGENLPRIRVYDKGYKNDSGVFTRFIPDGKVVVAFKNVTYGNVLGNYIMTSNAALNGSAGLFAGAGNHPKAPFLPWTARGHNGGIRVNYLRQFVVATVN